MLSNKTKYFYNHSTLKYEKVEYSLSKKIKNIAWFIVTSSFFAFLGVLFSYFYLDSPKEKQLRRDIEDLTLQYAILQKRIKQMDVVLEDMQERDKNIYRVIFGAEPISTSDWQSAFNNISRYKKFKNSNFYDLLLSVTRDMDQLSKKVYVQSKSFEEVAKIVKNKGNMIASIPAIQPVSNRNLTRMASGYGYRIHPIYKTRKMHTGMDFTAPEGTPIYATGNGVVTTADFETGYGNRVIINHGYGYKTLYAHMSKIKVKVGKKVKRGEIIGTVGNSGMSTGAHCHYEVIKSGKPVNPINYYYQDLTPAEYNRMIKLSSMSNQSFD